MPSALGWTRPRGGGASFLLYQKGRAGKRIANLQLAMHTVSAAEAMPHLAAGSQPFPQPKDKLRHGVSITDACIDWPTTEKLVEEIHAALAPRFG